MASSPNLDPKKGAQGVIRVSPSVQKKFKQAVQHTIPLLTRIARSRPGEKRRTLVTSSASSNSLGTSQDRSNPASGYSMSMGMWSAVFLGRNGRRLDLGFLLDVRAGSGAVGVSGMGGGRLDGS